MFKLPLLGYAYAALEPYIDAKTMDIHYNKHHATYIEKLNEALKDHSDLQNRTIEDLLSGIKTLPPTIQTAVQNNGGGHHNHSLFWATMKPNGSKMPGGKLSAEIDRNFGNLDLMKNKFNEAALGRFGSGWAWLTQNNDDLEIYSTANQDSPLMEGKKPILGLDLWEHAYYLLYQNRRPDYVNAWWNLVNWDIVATRLT